MIKEYFALDDISRKRLYRFLRLKRSVFSLAVVVIALFFSCTAEFWANSKPLVLYYRGGLYFPILARYQPAEFGRPELNVMDFRSLKLGDQDFSLWPLVPWDPLESNTKVATYPGPPSAENWMGTDDRGRDVLARLIYGFRYSMGFAILAWLFSFVIGTVLGGLMGFLGGMTDLIGQRLVEVFDSIPTFLLLITLVSIFGANLWLLVIFSSIFGWMMISVYIRAEFLRLRHREFVDAARAQGTSNWRMILRHILPNALGPIITFSPFTIAGGIYSLAALDYLGFGLPPPTPSWGELLQQAQNYFTIAWWLALYPSLAMVITLSALNLIGEGVRDAFDPRKA
jgi:microcin C transport system permease protein